MLRLYTCPRVLFLLKQAQRPDEQRNGGPLWRR
jgi:hypothetical protein